jgi:hypothetical protein
MKTFLTLILFSFTAIFVFPQIEDSKKVANLEEYGTNVPVILQNGYDEDFTLGTTWSSLPNAPSVFGRSTAGVIGNYLYIHTSQTTPSLALAFHIPTSTWSTSTSCGFPAFNSAFCVANGELYKLSGSGNVNAFEKFTPDGTGTGTWTTLTGGPTTIMTAQNSMVWDGGNYLYVSSSATSSPYTSYLQRYHITNGTWEARTGSLLPKRYAGMAYSNGYIYMIGGIEGSTLSAATCQKYNVSTDTWEQIAPLPEAVNFTKWSVDADNNYVYLVGAGGGFSPYAITMNVYYYDIAANTWLLDAALPAPRGLANGLLVDGFFKLFLGGGNDGSGGTAYQSTAWLGDGGVYVPVELTSFIAKVVDRSVMLNWSTATEVNNQGFEILRSAQNDNDWQKIGYVPGFGTTTEPKSYSYIDQSVSSGTYYYQLKQIDFDGSFTYSDAAVVEVSLPTVFSLEQNYPNPFNPITSIQFSLPVDARVTINIYNLVGENVAEVVSGNFTAGTHRVDVNAGTLTSGIYFYQLDAAGNDGKTFSSVKKMTLLK